MSGKDSDIEQLRNRHRHARSVLGADQLSGSASALVAQISKVDEFLVCKHVASYIAIRGEMDLQALMRRYADKIYYLPVLRGQNMFFAPWKPGAPLVKKAFGLLEPDASESDWISPKELDVVLLPLVVFDRHCNRIGQGGGFYDRTFEFLHDRAGVGKPVLVGVAHDSQCEPRLAAQAWDVPLDLVVTETSVYRRIC